MELGEVKGVKSESEGDETLVQLYFFLQNALLPSCQFKAHVEQCASYRDEYTGTCGPYFAFDVKS